MLDDVVDEVLVEEVDEVVDFVREVDVLVELPVPVLV